LKLKDYSNLKQTISFVLGDFSLTNDSNELLTDLHCKTKLMISHFSFLPSAVDLSNGQLTPNNNTPLLTQALSGEAVLGT